MAGSELVSAVEELGFDPMLLRSDTLLLMRQNCYIQRTVFSRLFVVCRSIFLCRLKYANLVSKFDTSMRVLTCANSSILENAIKSIIYSQESANLMFMEATYLDYIYKYPSSQQPTQ